MIRAYDLKILSKVGEAYKVLDIVYQTESIMTEREVRDNIGHIGNARVKDNVVVALDDSQHYSVGVDEALWKLPMMIGGEEVYQYKRGNKLRIYTSTKAYGKSLLNPKYRDITCLVYLSYAKLYPISFKSGYIILDSDETVDNILASIKRLLHRETKPFYTYEDDIPHELSPKPYLIECGYIDDSSNCQRAYIIRDMRNDTIQSLSTEEVKEIVSEIDNAKVVNDEIVGINRMSGVYCVANKFSDESGWVIPCNNETNLMSGDRFIVRSNDGLNTLVKYTDNCVKSVFVSYEQVIEDGVTFQALHFWVDKVHDITNAIFLISADCNPLIYANGSILIKYENVKSLIKDLSLKGIKTVGI